VFVPIWGKRTPGRVMCLNQGRVMVYAGLDARVRSYPGGLHTRNGDVGRGRKKRRKAGLVVWWSWFQPQAILKIGLLYF
jgi:hypothetical protein